MWDGSLNFLTIATSMGFRPLPLFNYAATVGIHSSLLLFTALFLPRTSLLIFDKTSNFPFLQPASSLDRPQPEFLEALTASPPLTLAWICVGVFLISFSWGGRIRNQAYEQRKPVGKTDFEAKEEEMKWRKQGAVVRLQLFLHLTYGSNLCRTCAGLSYQLSRLLSSSTRSSWPSAPQSRRTLHPFLSSRKPLTNPAATTSTPFYSRSFYPFSHISQLPTSLDRSPSQCSRAGTLTSC
jgi:hypothetical protein